LPISLTTQRLQLQPQSQDFPTSMIPAKIKQLLKEESLKDLWWIRLNGVVHAEAMSLKEVLNQKQPFAPHSIQILHGDLTVEPHSEWIDFQFSKKPTARKRKTVKKQTNEDVVLSMEQREIEMLRAELEERQKFIELSGRKRMHKAMETEFLQAELEQLSEDVKMQKR